MIVCDDEVSEAAMASDQEGENYMFSPFFLYLLLYVVNTTRGTDRPLPKRRGGNLRQGSKIQLLL